MSAGLAGQPRMGLCRDCQEPTSPLCRSLLDHQCYEVRFPARSGSRRACPQRDQHGTPADHMTSRSPGQASSAHSFGVCAAGIRPRA
ncbi:hypothetical protein Ae717Ps2_7216 [Pseudonocardia sp. Ae717_Ps2]|nr:hypothetical protein Ae717Ps2_7216 [Pseudonocardia sp. Ae717_Ps2]